VDNLTDHAAFLLDREGRIASWNVGARRVFGYDDAEILGRHGAELFTPEDRAAGEHARELAAAAADGRASDDRWQMRKGGERFWVSGVTSAVRDAAGNLRGFTKVCRDLTEQKRLIEQRERTLAQERLARAEAERAMAMRDEFLAIVSHELRTPLTSILLWAKLLESGSLAAEEHATAMTTIRRSAETQRQLVEDLLDISRITSGKLRLTMREADAAAFVRAAADVVRPTAEAKEVALEVDVGPGVGTVRADPDRLQQVVWNLLSNSVKFTGSGGRVRLSASRHDGALRIEVTDNGRGISADFLPHVFDLFRQAEGALTRTQGGLGLGLSICKTLVELHGGTIRAASPGVGRGATFTVELPARE
jgi:PAS domain S-box-containing protein